MKTQPMIAPAMDARVSSQKLASDQVSVNPSRMSTGTVKITPELEVFTALATVCTMLVSTIVPRRRILRIPNPSTAAIAEPPIVNPIFRPA